MDYLAPMDAFDFQYMRDDGVHTMEFKFLCKTPNWASEEGILVWRQDNDRKCLFQMWNQRLAKPTP